MAKKAVRKTPSRAVRKPEKSVADETVAENPYRSLETYRFLALLAAILALMVWIGLTADADKRGSSWILLMICMAAFVVVVGRGITGRWRGILIDARNKLSLSRLQMLAWSVIVLSAVLMAALANIEHGWSAPLAIAIPTELWVVMGISTASLVTSPAILGSKRAKKPAAGVIDGTVGVDGVDQGAFGLVACNPHPDDARWSDLMMGEEIGNFAHVDLGKLQMFLFTFVLTMSYSAAIVAMFRGAEIVTELPNVDEGMNVLLGISHTGYLMNKTVAHTEEQSGP